MRVFTLVLLLSLFLAGPAPAAPPGGVELRVVALNAAQQERVAGENGVWSPPLSLKLPDVGQGVEIDRRTEFHAVLIDRSGTYEGREVVFEWLHGSPWRAFAKPVTRTVRRFAGQPHPMAEYSCWSSPAKMGKFWSALFPSSVMKRSQWNASRCYGPRLVRVRGKDGEIIAERAFEIHKTGVRLY
ncbi:MAG: hypothetical protein K9K66_15910 [Desulfarculaceae bacterium]|nr:hypothetical protein [Desulfarculaceae bacterium]MCF8073628.1 hypothetical protein [Desulfarculaceae bacterium]MCF8103140.1 hypothetical protein [Desulfarculaceae bacterium]MCF8115656.1 hypothetical protein [Desulfarculaceae bacterium]